MIKLPERYKTVVTKLAGGGMSDTLVCRDSHLDRDVVIKSLKDGVDPKRLLDELSALSAIRSKHVVQVYDVIRDDKGAVVGFVEEYLTGKAIDGCVPPSNTYEALVLLYPIARGIADIHAHSRVHRDIKPNNMRCDAEGCLKIYDFGLAKIHAPSGGTANLYYTPGYTPLEALTKNAKGEYNYTTATDVYSFGVTAIELLSGAVPADLLAMPPVTDGPSCDFSKLPQNLPQAVCDLLRLCLDKNPMQRPDMEDIEKLLGKYLLHDKHKATLVLSEKSWTLSASNRTVKFRYGDKASVTIQYDGLSFRVTQVEGPVFINNAPVGMGFELPGACVIVMGPPEDRGRRGMITVTVSHPEVTL